jgi:predicted enzyme related to lactoylglutathione lyase
MMENKLNPINWFEIPANDLNKAKEFYEYILGVELSLNDMGPLKMAWFPMGQGAPGATGSLVQAEGYTPSYAGSLVYFSVADIERTLARVNEKGGKTLNPKMSIGEYGFVAHFEDCEGNRVALHSEK